MAAVLLSDFVWEGLSTEMPSYEEGARDGHVYKQLDTGESYIRRAGAWQFINLGLAYIKATKSGRLTTGAGGVGSVIFTTPFIDDEYSVALTCADPGTPMVIAYTSTRSATGFSIITRGIPSGLPQSGVTVSWLCTRDYDP